MMALFQTIHHPTIDCDNMFAKECANRAIDEIIKELTELWPGIKELGYWPEVKKELETL